MHASPISKTDRFCDITGCIDIFKQHDRLPKHFETVHGTDIENLSNRLAPLVIGPPQPPPLAIVPPPELHNQPIYSITLPRVQPGASRKRTKPRTTDTDSHSLFGSSSDSEPEASSSKFRPTILASPRKKRGVKLASSRPTRLNGNGGNRATLPPVNSEDTYGDPPNGEYEPSEGFRLFRQIDWLGWDLPEHQPPTGQATKPLPPVFAHSRNIADTNLDGEPPIVREVLRDLKKLGKSRDPTNPDLIPPNVGFDALWDGIRETQLGIDLERTRVEERAQAEEVKLKKKQAKATKGKAKGKGRADGERQLEPNASGSKSLLDSRGTTHQPAGSSSLETSNASSDADRESDEDVQPTIRDTTPTGPILVSPTRKSSFKIGGSKMRIQSPS